jgi:hypothetical protein
MAVAVAKLREGLSGRMPKNEIEIEIVRSGLKLAVVTEHWRQNFARRRSIFGLRWP